MSAKAGETDTKREPLSRARIVACAVAIADAEGIEALSMRRVAHELGATPMALYNHVGGKDELFNEIAGYLLEEGIDVRVGARAEAAHRANGRRVLVLEGGEEIAAEELLIATGRRPRVDGIGLESLGIEPDPKGIEIDERCRAADGVWAIGDVTGVMPFTHVGMYQGRIACADIAGRPAKADYTAIPRVVFSDPEIAAVGLTEQQARDRGTDIATSRVSLPDVLARPWTYEQDPRGDLGLIADRERRVLVGAWAVAPLAGEWIHQAALAIKTQTPIEVLRDTVAQFPTFSEAYLKGVEALEV